MRMIDADALEQDGWRMNRIVQINEKTMEYQTRKPTDFPAIEPKKGKWIDKSNGIEGAWNYCSVCGEQAIDLYDFCPNCGADMREGETDG